MVANAERKVVLRIGGSVLGSPPQAKLLKGYAEAINEGRKLGLSIAVVVGGGPVARSYIAAASRHIRRAQRAAGAR